MDGKTMSLCGVSRSGSEHKPVIETVYELRDKIDKAQKEGYSFVPIYFVQDPEPWSNKPWYWLKEVYVNINTIDSYLQLSEGYPVVEVKKLRKQYKRLINETT